VPVVARGGVTRDEFGNSFDVTAVDDAPATEAPDTSPVGWRATARRNWRWARWRSTTVVVPGDAPPGSNDVQSWCDMGTGPQSVAHATFTVNAAAPPRPTTPTTSPSTTTTTTQPHA
jgi:hypothetical protein